MSVAKWGTSREIAHSSTMVNQLKHVGYPSYHIKWTKLDNNQSYVVGKDTCDEYSETQEKSSAIMKRVASSRSQECLT